MTNSKIEKIKYISELLQELEKISTITNLKQLTESLKLARLIADKDYEAQLEKHQQT